MNVYGEDPPVHATMPARRADRIEFRPARPADSMHTGDHVLIIRVRSGNCVHDLSKADLAELIGKAAAYLAGLA